MLMTGQEPLIAFWHFRGFICDLLSIYHLLFALSMSYSFSIYIRDCSWQAVASLHSHLLDAYLRVLLFRIPSTTIYSLLHPILSHMHLQYFLTLLPGSPCISRAIWGCPVVPWQFPNLGTREALSVGPLSTTQITYDKSSGSIRKLKVLQYFLYC